MFTESYSQHLVNLMAKENLSLTFSSDVDTAAIDLTKRTITINSFLSEFQDDVLSFERLLTHEVGHALYTPKNSFSELVKKYTHTLVNIFEDIRIENLLKEKFVGIRKLFHKGFYALDELLSTRCGFPSVNQLSENSLFIDKLNYYFKSNCLHPINFTEREFEFVKKLQKFVDFEDMEEILSEFVTNFIPEKKESKQFKNTKVSIDNTKELDLQPEDTSLFNQVLLDDIKEFLQDSLSIKQEEIIDKLKLDNKLKKINQPVTDIMGNVLPTIHNSALFKFLKSNCKDKNLSYFARDSLESKVDDILSMSEKSAQLLFIEFERQKNAKNFKESKSVNTGALDLSRISSYRVSTKLFKHATIFPNQENHEVIILLDWSDSIKRSLMNLIKEAITITLFCKKAKIPCSVFAFIKNGSIRYFGSEDMGTNPSTNEYDGRLVEMLSTESKNFVENTRLLLLLGASVSGKYVESIAKSYKLRLGSTPLNQTVFNIPTILQQKIAKNKRISLVIISDGMSDEFKFNDQTNRGIFIDPLTKKIHTSSFKSEEKVNTFLYSRLRITFPMLSILAIHIVRSQNDVIDQNGFLFNMSLAEKDEIFKATQSTGVWFKRLPLFDHLIIKVKSVNDTSEITSNSTDKKITKSEFTKMLSNNIHPMSKYIYKQIASSIS